MNANIIKVPSKHQKDVLKVIEYLLELQLSNFKLTEIGDFYYLHLDQTFTQFWSRKRDLVAFLKRFDSELIEHPNEVNAA